VDDFYSCVIYIPEFAIKSQGRSTSEGRDALLNHGDSQMPLIAVFLVVFAMVFLWLKSKSAGTVDALHRAAVAAIVCTIIAFMVAIIYSYR